MEETKDIGGRPLMYETAEELDSAIAVYMADAGKKPTLTGLALFLGFQSRQSIYDYEERGQFSYAIKRARLTIESMYEAKLYEPACTGAIFALKNFGWEDKSTTKHQGDPDAPVFFQLDPRFGT